MNAHKRYKIAKMERFMAGRSVAAQEQELKPVVLEQKPEPVLDLQPVVEVVAEPVVEESVVEEPVVEKPVSKKKKGL